MRLLAIDTTTPFGSAAVLEKARLLGEVNIASPATHSERLLPAVDFLLRALGWKITDVEAFALAVGPGSFTGIRVGMSTVKSFAYASGKPVAPVSTLEALGWKLRQPQNRLLCPVLDAKKKEIYAALFQVHRGRLQPAVSPGVFNPDRFFSLLPAHRIIHFIGTGVDVYREKIIGYFKDKARLSDRSLFIAPEVGMIGSRILGKGEGVCAHELVPLYYRRSQAEEGH